MMQRSIVFVTFFLCGLSLVKAVTKSVTYYNGTIGQLFTSSTLFWDTYYPDDEKISDHAVKGAVFEGEQRYPSYVCRAQITGLLVSGHTKRDEFDQTMCVVSMYSEVRLEKKFEILINKENGAKLAWKPWNTFTGKIFSGSVSSSNRGGQTNEETFYVARRRNNHTSKSGDFDYLIGRFDPTAGLGKIIVSEKRVEKSYENGEILVDLEPTRYELDKIRIEKHLLDIQKNKTQLGQTVMFNEGEEENDVQTVITYSYDKISYWGVHEGIARNIPLRVHERLKTDELLWGHPRKDFALETKTISTRLPPGTGINVTMWGNYTRIEGPYHAHLISIYGEGDNAPTSKRDITAKMMKTEMLDVQIEYSPVYWIHNQTLVPTTTTTQRTTSTSTQDAIVNIEENEILSSSSSSLNHFIEGIVSSTQRSQDKAEPHQKSSSVKLKLNVALLNLVTLVCVIYY